MAYDDRMDTVSPEIEKDIKRRLAAGPYGSVDDLLRQALTALDEAREAALEILEHELLRGFEGDDVEMTASDWDAIEREAVTALESKKTE